MPKFKIYATATNELELEIEADDFDQAMELQKDYIAMDFDLVQGNFKINGTVEVEK